MATRSLLSQATVQNYIKSNPVTDAEIKAKYDEEVAKSSGDEYKARHILLKDEAQAKKIIEKLTAGGDFKALAIKHSTGPSGPQGGDLGWFVDGQMVAAFSKAVIALENGAFTKEAIKTQFGWHIILREDSRKQTPPPFDTIKEQLRPALQQKKIQDMLKSLREKAKVEILVSIEEPEIKAPDVAANPAEIKKIEKQAKNIEAAEAVDVGAKADEAKTAVVAEPVPATDENKEAPKVDEKK
ncbi:MAG: peptidylprolyl isomerase [Methylococcales bacterium]|nr:peptidylprolyl isomerase [Methylococcales bacterium]